MERIASFTVDHNVLTPGLYLSRRDGNTVTFDLRFKKPNTGDLLTNAELHSVEHIIATLLRNSEQKDAVIYFGPMGCQTGFYFLFGGAQLTDGEAIRLLQQVFAAGAAFEGEMPGCSAAECGNYRNLDVALARNCCRYYAEVIADWTEEKLAYPTK
jgi:S-ribosylhomocysteine lyase